MTGSSLIIIIITLWTIFALWFTRKLTTHVRKRALRTWLSITIFIALHLLPIADELITAPQFHTLCEKETKLKFDAQTVRGKTIYLQKATFPYPEIQISLLRGYFIPWTYKDAHSNELVISYKTYHIQGGIFMQLLGISETTAPLIIESYCAPPESNFWKYFLNKNGLTQIAYKDLK